MPTEESPQSTLTHRVSSPTSDLTLESSPKHPEEPATQPLSPQNPQQQTQPQPHLEIDSSRSYQQESFWCSEFGLEIIKAVLIFVLFVVLIEIFTSWTKFVPKSEQEIIDEYLVNNPHILSPS